MAKSLFLLLLLAVITPAIGCGEPSQSAQSSAAPPSVNTSAASPPPAPSKIEKLTAKNLPNPVRVHEKVISGGLPEGDEAFAELAALGIKTVISVDGANPDVATAKKHGLRYVHLPHGYDGVPADRARELAKAVRDLPGPVYIHCHHGKHRSPAAAAVACIGAGFITHPEAALVLQVAGTSPNYRGLFKSTDSAQAFDAALLDAMNADFPESAKLPAMAGTMVAIEHIHDHLKLIEIASWKTPPDNPALSPDHEALLLREQFTELLRTDEVKTHSEEFQKAMQEAEQTALALEEALKKLDTSPSDAAKLFATVTNNCKSCHQTFRDIPLDEK